MTVWDEGERAMKEETRPGAGAGEEGGDGEAWLGCFPEIESEGQEAARLL